MPESGFLSVLADVTLEVSFLAAVVVPLAALATWIVLLVARRTLIDVPNERSSHAAPTPKGGGISVVGVVLVCIGGTTRFDWSERTYPALLGVAMLVACAVGLWDDLRPLRPVAKLCGLLAAGAFVAVVFDVSVVPDVPFVGEIRLRWAALPLTLFWLAGYANAFNFMDGLNGMAALTAFVSAAFFFVAQASVPNSGSTAEVAAVASAAAIAGVAASAVLGFLPFNFPKARIFMGDSGSLPLGLLLAWCAVCANATGALAFPASVLLLGPFLFDVTFTLFRRWREGKPIGAAHKEHLYQRLSRVWGSHAKVSLLYAGFSCATGALALAYASMSDVGKLLSLVLPTLAMLGFAALVLRAEGQQGR